jgi:hypothetical protein
VLKPPTASSWRGLSSSLDRAQSILSKFVAQAWRFLFTLCFPQLFRFDLVPRFVLKSGFKFIRQKPPGQKSVQGLTCLLATPDSNASGSVAQFYSVPLQEAFLKVLLGAPEGRKTGPQRSRFLVRYRENRHDPLVQKVVLEFK